MNNNNNSHTFWHKEKNTQRKETDNNTYIENETKRNETQNVETTGRKSSRTYKLNEYQH